MLESHNNLHIEQLTGAPGDENLLAIHGLLGSYRYFNRIATELNGDFNVLGVNLLGFGSSPKPRGPYSIESHASLSRRQDKATIEERY